MKSVVVYRSKSGFAKKYAEWIAEELGADLFAATHFKPEMFADYDRIVYGGGLYVGGINGVKLVLNNLNQLDGKKVAVFATGASPAHKEAIQEVKKKNFQPEQLKRIGFFYLRGGFDYGKLNSMDKVLMILLKLKIALKKEARRNADERGMLAAYKHPEDFTKKKNIQELIAFIR